MRARDDDQGAVAILVGLMALVLMSIAAMAVDLGLAYVEDQEVQEVTDFAALAGAAGNNLPGTVLGTCPYGQRAAPTDQAVRDVATYLAAKTWTQSLAPADLVDCSTANGEVVYGTVTGAANTSGVTLAYDPNQLTVLSPGQRVAFGFASVMGFDSTVVRASATVQIGTPGSPKTIPAYAVSGCDWGLQTITSPANGQVVSRVPVLANPDDANVATLDPAASPNPSPAQVSINPGPTTVTITGTKLGGVTKVGFFREGDGGAAPPPTVIPGNAITHVDASTITISLPDATNAPELTATDQLWWVRVWAPESTNSATSAWSAVGANGEKIVPFEVGTPYFRCVGDSNEGNYGTLKLPRTDSTNSTNNGWMPLNFAQNLQAPLSLHTYPGAPSVLGGVSTAPDLCDPADAARTIYSTTTSSPILRANTNCVDADTGLPANSVTAGFIEGIGATKGRLIATAATPCAGTRSLSLSGNRQYTINNDLLTCFLTSGISLGTISGPGYTGGPALSCELFDSPRFFYQPVLQVRPSSGGSHHYSIVDFRPAFVTSQSGSATKANPGADGDNGLVISGGQITEVNVVFFNNRALSQDCPGSFGPSLGGTTTRSLRLVD